MLKQEIEYEDFNGQKRKETFYFNLTKAEVTEMETSMAKNGRLSTFIENVVAANNEKEIISLFKTFILKLDKLLRVFSNVVDSVAHSADFFSLIVWDSNVEFFFEFHDQFYSVE